jgi:hypothetical protein
VTKDVSCGEPVTRAGKKFCSPRCRRVHGARVYRARKKALYAEVPPAPIRSRKARRKSPRQLAPGASAEFSKCSHCDVVLIGLAAIRGTCREHTETSPTPNRKAI